LLSFTKHLIIGMRKEEGNPSNKSAVDHWSRLSFCCTGQSGDL
jgi:hypothetical protein